MIMKKSTTYSLLLLGILLSASCAKEATEDSTAAAERRVNSWISVHSPEATQTDNGIWILEETPGTGDTWDLEGKGIAYVSVTTSDLDGNISSTTDEDIARQIGSWSRNGSYGPSIWYVSSGALPDAYGYILDGMRIGGTRKALLPSWTLSKGSSHTIMDLRFDFQSDNIVDYQVERLKEFSARYMANEDSTFYNAVDGDRFGFYFHRLREAEILEEMPSDTTVYVNYIGRRLDGVVFDTTIADTAKFYGIYDSSKTYAPIPVYWGETYDDIKITSSKSDAVDGFQMALWHMHPGEKAITAFYSVLGYGSSGSGSSIPAYAPLSFTIDMVEEP